ncbi:MAG: site-2 protease family protein [Geobacter sp.]|nr:MAG: site-2 protease family protein [Geobacter sp.]
MLHWLGSSESIVNSRGVNAFTQSPFCWLIITPVAGGRTAVSGTHLYPFKTLLIFIFGFGAGKPVPFNPFNLRNKKWGGALVGLAGPSSNFLSALIAGFLLRFLNFNNPSLIVFFSVFIWINLVLGTFNLLPIPPLDGSHIFLAALPSLAGKFILFFRNPFLIIIAFFFMVYVGVPYICAPLFTIITGVSSPF